MKTKPNCYECKWRGEVPGDAHSKCSHPKIGNPLLVLLGNQNPLNIRGNVTGIRRGWFTWPINFDPVWLEQCDGFEGKEVKSTHESQTTQ